MANLTSLPGTSAPLGDNPEPGDPPLSADAEDRLYEVVDGQIVETPSMGSFEADIANLLCELLNAYLRKSQMGRAFVEMLFWLDRAGRFKRRPDLAFVSARKWPIRKRAPKGEAWDLIPDLAVEVVNGSNIASDINVKLLDYFRAGVQQVWVIYPVSRQVYVYTTLTTVQILTETAELEGGDVIPGFHLALKELFEDAEA